ncbi:hypothetical protein HRbin10_02600 [bacterium HR10]|nr:hypothetical protein HRbin10_02600 [bacterium HR10]
MFGDELHGLLLPLLQLQDVVVAEANRLFRGPARRLQLLAGALQSDLFLLQGADESRGEIIPSLLDGRANLGIEFGDLSLQGRDLFLQKLLRGHDLSDILVHLGELVAHVADDLLQDQLRVLRALDEPPEDGS